MFNFLNGMSSPRSSSSSLQNDEDSGTLLGLFESFVSNQKTSENVALCTEMGVQLSYTQLNDKAEVLSSHINSHIAQDGKPHLVGIMMERDAGFIASILASLKSRTTYVPVDPSFPPDRQTHILSHSNSELVITDQNTYDKALELGVVFPPCIIIDPGTCQVQSKIDAAKIMPNQSLTDTMEHLAYVLYTSGSTGKPKGVVIYQSSVFNIVTYYTKLLNVTTSSKVMALTTFCFDISVLEIFMPLVSGGTLVLAKSSTQKDPFRLLEVIEERKVNVFQATPTSYEMMLATGWTGDESIDFLVGGEACRPAVLPVAHKCKSLWNVYGPTETTIWSSSYHITSEFAVDLPKSVPVGKPISATSFYIVSLENGEPSKTNPKLCNDGDEGELWIGGDGVAFGYLNAPELTEKVFFPNPFGKGRVYRTGDVAKKLENGDYMFGRRLDDQVKIDGYRIELGEIEAVYNRSESIEKCVALVRSNKLVLYVKSSTSQRVLVDMESIHDTAKRSLTHYMIPKAVVFIDKFPQTANGKLDKKALPDPPEPTSSIDEKTKSNDDNDATETMGLLDSLDRQKSSQRKTISSTVLDIVEELRGTRPKLSATLAALGVDSLGSIMLVRRLSDTFGGLAVRPKDVFGPGLTISVLSKNLSARLQNELPGVLQNYEEEEHLDVESGGADKGIQDDLNDTQVQGVHKAEIKFDELVAGNINLFEGCRGVLALLVLWEHYHDPKYEINFAVACDSACFFIVAGLTVALQFRMLPVHLGRIDSGVRLLPRKSFDAIGFLQGKYLGIFPLLWFTLLICMPNWYMDEPKHVDDPTCYPMWIFGVQTMSQKCVNNGPYGIWFASTLIIILFVYSIGRSIFGYLQDLIIANRSKDFIVPYTNPNGEERTNRPRNNKEYICNTVTLMAYNRPNMPGAFLLTIFWFSVSFMAFYQAGFMRIKGYGISEKSPSSNLGYFLSGVACASLAESWHFALHASSKSVDDSMMIILQELGLGACMSIHDRRVLANDIKNIALLLWRFVPDMIFALAIFFCSSYGILGTDEVAKMSMWVTLPMMFISYLFVSLVQQGNNRKNLTRMILESKPLGMIGYSSLNMFLFQHIWIEFYAPYLDTGTVWMKSAKNKWFHKLPIYQRLFWMSILIIISYSAQWLVQEKLVLFLYGKFTNVKKTYTFTMNSVLQFFGLGGWRSNAPNF